MPTAPETQSEPTAANAGFWRRRLLQPLLDQLRQGVSPHELALTLALGVTVAVLPVLGSTTLICALLAVWLRLNQPLIQLVNYLMYPLQLALLFPFLRAGEWLFRQPPVPLFSISALMERFSAGPGQFLLDYGRVGLYGLVVWLLCAPLLMAVIYWSSRPLLTRMARLRTRA